MDDERKNQGANPRVLALGRRDLMKLGIGAGFAITSLRSSAASAQTAGLPTGGLDEAPKQNLQRWPDIRASKQVVASAQNGLHGVDRPGLGEQLGPSCRERTDGRVHPADRRIRELVL